MADKSNRVRPGCYVSSGRCANGHDRSILGVKPVKGRFKCVACLDEKRNRKDARKAFRAEHPNAELPPELQPRESTTRPPAKPESDKPKRVRTGSRAAGTNPRALGTNPRARLEEARAIVERFGREVLDD